MAAPTYGFYSEEFGGFMGEEDFKRLLPRAVRYVDWVIGYKRVCDAHERRYQEAVCATVDVFHDSDPDAVGDFAIGSFRMDVGRNSGRSVAINAVTEILAPTGLLYGGV